MMFIKLSLMVIKWFLSVLIKSLLFVRRCLLLKISLLMLSYGICIVRLSVVWLNIGIDMIRVQVYFPKAEKVVMERFVNCAPDAFPFSDTEKVLRLLYHPKALIRFSVTDE